MTQDRPMIPSMYTRDLADLRAELDGIDRERSANALLLFVVVMVSAVVLGWFGLESMGGTVGWIAAALGAVAALVAGSRVPRELSRWRYRVGAEPALEHLSIPPPPEGWTAGEARKRVMSLRHELEAVVRRPGISTDVTRPSPLLVLGGAALLAGGVLVSLGWPVGWMVGGLGTAFILGEVVAARGAELGRRLTSLESNLESHQRLLALLEPHPEADPLRSRRMRVEATLDTLDSGFWTWTTIVPLLAVLVVFPFIGMGTSVDDLAIRMLVAVSLYLWLIIGMAVRLRHKQALERELEAIDERTALDAPTSSADDHHPVVHRGSRPKILSTARGAERLQLHHHGGHRTGGREHPEGQAE